MGSNNKGLWPSLVPPRPKKMRKKKTLPVAPAWEEDVVPEGPELRRSADVLAENLIGKNFIDGLPRKTGRYRKKAPAGQEQFLNELADTRHGGVITEVNVKGKFMWWHIVIPETDADWYLFCTYGMSGQWAWHLTKYTSYTVHYSDHTDPTDPFINIHFNDIRNFGTLKFVKGTGALEKKLASLGPDMLSNPPTLDEFVGCLRKKDGWNVCKALMNQGVVSGVGNYVKCEALYLARIDPESTVIDLSDGDLHRLCACITDVMVKSYENNGATFSTYQNPDGSSGDAPKRFACYRQKTDPKGNPVKTLRTADGRTTHWVPAVQRS